MIQDAETTVARSLFLKPTLHCKTTGTPSAGGKGYLQIYLTGLLSTTTNKKANNLQDASPKFFPL